MSYRYPGNPIIHHTSGSPLALGTRTWPRRGQILATPWSRSWPRRGQILATPWPRSWPRRGHGLGHAVAKCWPRRGHGLGHAVAKCWPRRGQMLATPWPRSWPPRGQILATPWPRSWPPRGQILATAWPNIGHAVASIWPRGGQYLVTRWPVSGHVVAKTVAMRWLIFGLVDAADATLGGWSRPAGRGARHHAGQPRRHVWGAWRSRSRPLPRSRYLPPSAPPSGRLAAAPARGRPSWSRTRSCTRPPRRSSRRARTLSCDRITT